MQRGLKILLFVFPIGLHALSQSVAPNIVQQVDSLNHLSEQYEIENNEMAREVAKEALDISARNNYFYGMGYSMSSLGKAYMTAGSYDTAQYFFERCLDIDSITDSPSDYVVDLSNLAMLKGKRGDYESSVQYYFQALEISEENEMDLYSAMIYNNLANRYKELGQPENSLDACRKAMDIWTHQQHPNPGQQNYYLGSLYLNLSILYSEFPEIIPADEPNIAMACLDKATEHFEVIEDEFKLRDADLQRARILSYNGKSSEALKLAVRSRDYFVEIDFPLYIGDSRLIVTRVLADLGRFDEALAELDKAEVEADSVGIAEIQERCLFTRSEVLRTMGRYEESSNVLNEAYAYKDSVLGQDLKVEINEIQAKYDLSKERADRLELEALTKEQEQREANLYNSILMLSLVLVVLITAAFFFFRYRRQQNLIKLTEYQKNIAHEKQQISELNLRLLASQMNPHFTKNAVNAIKSLIEKKELEKSNEYLSAFGRLQKNILENASGNTIYLSDELDLIEDYIKVEQLRQDGAFDYSIMVDDEFDKEYDRIPSMMLQPVVENAIVHGLFHKEGKGFLKIEMRKETKGEVEFLRCMVEDNGVGRQYTSGLRSGRKSHSMEILNKRIEILSSTSEMDSFINIVDLYDEDNNPTGTRVELRLPFH